jgi:hypothetical protein
MNTINTQQQNKIEKPPVTVTSTTTITTAISTDISTISNCDHIPSSTTSNSNISEPISILPKDISVSNDVEVSPFSILL